MYKLAQRELWKGRIDSEQDSAQFRHFQTIHFGDINEAPSGSRQGIGILGYAVDKGVELNKGELVPRGAKCYKASICQSTSSKYNTDI